MSIDTLPLVGGDDAIDAIEVLSCTLREWHAMKEQERSDWHVISMTSRHIRALRAPAGHDIVRVGSQLRLDN